MKVFLVLCTIFFLLLPSLLIAQPSSLAIMDVDSNASKMDAPVGDPSRGEFLEYEWPQIHGDSSSLGFQQGLLPEHRMFYGKSR